MDAVAVLVFELQPPLAGAVVHGVVVVLLAVLELGDDLDFAQAHAVAVSLP